MRFCFPNKCAYWGRTRQSKSTSTNRVPAIHGAAGGRKESLVPFIEDVSTGELGETRLRIEGRPRPGGREQYVIVEEEPDRPIRCHYKDKEGNLPHWDQGCPNCEACGPELRLMVYIGAFKLNGIAKPQLCILELTDKCFSGLEAAAKVVPVLGPLAGKQVELIQSISSKPVFIGLHITIYRSAGVRAERIIRCEPRRQAVKPCWTFHTRRELARIWGVPVKPKLGVFRGQHG